MRGDSDWREGVMGGIVTGEGGNEGDSDWREGVMRGDSDWRRG